MSRKIKIYNTLSRKKEEFKSIIKNHVGLYVCGPTVYGDPHLGHARPAITFDVVFRYLNHSNYKVRYVRNITDAGHLENDAEEGEDKIAKKARLEALEPMEVVQFYTISYHKAMNALNCLPPSIEPRATGHIIEQIEMVKQILKNGFAYEVNGSIYLDVNKYNKKYPYGTLSGRNIEDTLEGTRVLDGQSEKKSAVDFAIWKKATSEHIMRWSSPWGEGFPGWHMECSAMSEKYLGKTFDIHGGGMDLVFPHHEAEIAQSNACNNCNPVNYWMHNNMITVDGKKMGKSLGNFINLEEFFNGTHDKLDRAYSPMTIRFFILQAHYRSTIDFSNVALQAAEKGLKKLMNAMETLQSLTSSDSSTYDVSGLEKKCYESINDDFNTPIVIAHLFDGVRIINSVKDGKESLKSSDVEKLKSIFNIFVNDILGLVATKESSGKDLTNEIMELVLQLRGNAKKNKDFNTADLIRDELDKVGIQIKDSREGSSWEVKN
ncbi:cysteine--tRNA ligase [Flavobacteriales bacterium]|jgi:cysteinyl-tRNA synthetase|nr:cysteine--tRNA ligase [Flavobacteriales bacterium]MDA7596191.1 cysteine--tRNA ligase [Flavobacteriales bacterium]MDC3390336.1 cysteine--tRNA ligase [Flavobacteriales bacterium]